MYIRVINWPKKNYHFLSYFAAIYTAAMEMLGGGSEVASQCRTVDIMADSAYAVLCR